MVSLCLELVLILIARGYSSCTQRTTMPGGNSYMIIGFDGTSETIYLVGGYQNEKHLVSYTKLTNWTDYGSDALPSYVWAKGQSYTQDFDNILYFFRDSSDITLQQFDLSTQTFTTYPTQPSIDKNSFYGEEACLCYVVNDYDEYLIFTLQSVTWILDLTNQTFITSLDDESMPLMNNRLRQQHACIVEPISGYLYVIGGFTSGSGWHGKSINTIEKLYVGDIMNINQYSFYILNETLNEGIFQSRAILYETDIYIIGGYRNWGSNGKSIDDIYLLDTRIDSVSVFCQLYEGITGPTPILIGTTIYVFGGATTDWEAATYYQSFNVLSIPKYFMHYV